MTTSSNTSNAPYLPAETLYALVEILIQRACTALWADRLNEDRRRATAHLIETELALQIVEIVREKLLRVFKDVKRNAVRLCELGAGNTDAVGELIAPAVIGAAHLDDVFILRGKARDTHRSHAGLGTGVEHAEHFNIGHAIAYLFGKLVFKFVEQAGGRAAGVEQFNDLIAHNLWVRSEHRRAASLQKVIVFVAVDIIEIRALRLGEHQRKRVVEGKIMLHAAGDYRFGLLDHLFGLRALFVEIILFIALEGFWADGVDRQLDQLVELLGDGRRIRIIADSITIVHTFSFLLHIDSLEIRAFMEISS